MSPTLSTMSLPLRRLPGLISKISKSSSFAIAYMAAVLPQPCGPLMRTAFASRPGSLDPFAAASPLRMTVFFPSAWLPGENQSSSASDTSSISSVSSSLETTKPSSLFCFLFFLPATTDFAVPPGLLYVVSGAPVSTDWTLSLSSHSLSKTASRPPCRTSSVSCRTRTWRACCRYPARLMEKR